MRWLLCLLLLTGGASFGETLGTSLDGTRVSLEKGQRYHLVFFDIWQDGYAQPGLGDSVSHLPERYLKETQIIWIQPRFNITDAQIAGFLANQTLYTPLIVDEDFSLMRRFKIWETPAHVIFVDGAVVFKGNIKQLKDFLRKGK